MKCIIFIFRIIFIFTFIILLSACSTTKKTQKINIDQDSVNINQNFVDKTIVTSEKKINIKYFSTEVNMQAKALIEINFPTLNHSVSANLEIAGKDSVLIKINAFLGINVGQLYANKNDFVMNNNIESITYIGSPTVENIMRTTFMPLSFSDLISTLKCVILENIDNYKYNNTDNFFYYTDNYKNESVYINDSDNIIKIVRKDKNGNDLFFAEYNDYITINEKRIAKKIIVNFPALNGTIKINYSDIQFKDKPTSPMRINKPKSYKLIEIN